jgi:hypothetical protein
VFSALHRLESYPPDLQHSIFAQYPAMKYGERRAVEHYARLLAPRAAEMIATAPLDEWVLTSPPVRSLPSGANLLCGALSRRLGLRRERLDLVDDPQPFRDEKQFAAYGDYAKLDYRTRCAVQYRADEVSYDEAALRGRQVVFVNDINVTGAQMRWIGAVLERAAPRAVHWLYIVDVAPQIGRAFPQVEDEINSSRLAGRDEIAAFLRDAELRCTTKLAARLLGFGSTSLERIFRSIDAAKRRGLLEALYADATYASEFLKRKLAFAENQL